tara:strand:- start:597 stop:2126 length:1530 start_codon:yes stop_codon:yes gene_type:complete
MQKASFLFLLLIFPYSLIGQQIDGEVFSEDKPLEGVNIVNATSSSGTTTNSKGNFSLEAVFGDTLVFSYVGMNTFKIRINDYEKLIVKMDTAVNSLEETIVVGKKKPSEHSLAKSETFNSIFGERNLKNAGYTVNQVRGSEVQNYEGQDRGVIPAIVYALQGKVASYRIGTGGVVLRSGGSLSQATNALWEIDGQLFEGFPPPINLQTIDNVYVIKSLAGTTLYGARGAGGVIIVNTIYNKANQKNNKEINNNEFGQKGVPYNISDINKNFEGLESNSMIYDKVVAIGNDINNLRGLAYYCQSKGRQLMALRIYRLVLSLSKDKMQSFRDIAQTWAVSNRPLDAWSSYLTALEINDGKFDSNIGKMMYHEMERLYLTENLEDKINGGFEVQSDFSVSKDKTTRIVIEWSSEEHNFSIEVLNPSLQAYTYNFGPSSGTNQRMEEFFLDDTLKGEWSFNIIREHQNQNDLHLKVTIYKNWYSTLKSVPRIYYYKFFPEDKIKYNLFDLNVF